MKTEKDKLGCIECGWQGEMEDLLFADDPFNEGAEISACPKCRCIETTVGLCDEPGCTEQATIGTPTDDGYRRVCYKHEPK